MSDPTLDIEKWEFSVPQLHDGECYARAFGPESDGWIVVSITGPPCHTKPQAEADLDRLKSGVEDLLNRLNGGPGLESVRNSIKELHAVLFLASHELGDPESMATLLKAMVKEFDEWAAAYDEGMKGDKS